MSQWPASKSDRILRALLRIGWRVKRQSGSHKTLEVGTALISTEGLRRVAHLDRHGQELRPSELP